MKVEGRTREGEKTGGLVVVEDGRGGRENERWRKERERQREEESRERKRG